MNNKERELKLLEFTGQTVLKIPVDKVLDSAKKNNLNECLVVGVDENGMMYFNSTTAEITYLLKLLKETEKVLYSMIEL